MATDTNPLPPPQPTAPGVLEDYDRMTANLNVHHQHHGEQPTSVATSYTSLLDTIEQPYTRRVEIDETPTPLDTGWVENVGCIVIENRTGQRLLVNPSDVERAAITASVVRVSCGGTPGLLVRPGRFLFTELENAATVTLQCLQGTALVYLTIFPK